MFKSVIAALVMGWTVGAALPATAAAQTEMRDRQVEACETGTRGFDCYLAADVFGDMMVVEERNRLLNLACQRDYTYCATAGLAQMEEQPYSYAEPNVNYETALEALERGCRAHFSHNDQGPAACLRAGEINTEGLTGGSPYSYIRQDRAEAQRLFRHGCERHNDDDNCVALATLLVDHYSDKQSQGEALELFRISCRRGNDASCDRVARFIDY
ncbi:hypothetical protein [Maricaulis sp.]|uniref:hypothetical protein n=1 Tax=Maricaulis sp. TaxID=1486257 RepID=UPI00260A8AD3|nr:hypothetical protein [Maricaulis sp.]